MCTHAADAGVQQWASWALINITADDDVHRDVRRQATADAGALPRSSRRCARTRNAEVQEQACWALGNITFGDDAQGYACKQAAVDAGALPQIVAAMRAHAGNEHATQYSSHGMSPVSPIM
ncbi:hypothetical protein T492DRAFT_894676 [Pavlovales sp. CCMP2436]|nr:hypothetical protein T492DRAFT_894676 [Pavlovales sp. CCMP2436]